MNPITFDDYKEAARNCGYNVIERRNDHGPILNIISRVCHPDGDDPYGVWVKEHNGYATAYCHRCPHPTADRNVRQTLGLPSWEDNAPNPIYKHRNGSNHNGTGRHPYNPESPTQSPAQAAYDPEAGARRAARIWGRAMPIPDHPHSPPRRWLDRRNLWWPELPLPTALRWISFGNLTAIHRRLTDAKRSGGAIVLLLATPQEWADCWPDPPPAAAVQCIYVDGIGQPTILYDDDPPDLGKRNYGLSHGRYALFGDPNFPAETTLVTEGAADGLALASRQPAPVIVANGAGAMKQEPLQQWLSSLRNVQIYADLDERGQRDAHALRQRLSLEGVNAHVFVMPSATKDPAAASANGPPLGAVDRKTLARQVKAQGFLRPDAETLRQAALDSVTVPLAH